MNERLEKAAKRYLKIRGYADFDEEVNGFLVFEDRGVIVFLSVVGGEEGFQKTLLPVLKSRFEEAIVEYFSRYPQDGDRDIRCDEISFIIVSEDRAVLRHEISVFNSPF